MDVAAADDTTAFAFHAMLASLWAATSVDRTIRAAGHPGGRLRCYLDIRQGPLAGRHPALPGMPW
ncbi:DUF6207 family protein [Streptomyces parvulus]|uniref:DUF6207 family protein n=1 Tax=Streptomyces parvulus TaxID=146923 RepID=UPI0036A87C9D